MKQGLLNLMMAAGAFAPFRLANRGKALVLTYHRFGEDARAETPARLFAAQIEYLCARYTVVPLSLVAARLREGAALPPYSAAITIDDGYRDAYEIAFPVLRRYGVPATVFVVTDFLDRKGWLWTDKLRFLALRTGAREAELMAAGCRLRLEGRDRDARLAAAGRVNEAMKRMPDEVKEETLTRFAAALGLPLPAEPPAEFTPMTWQQAREMGDNGVEIGSHTVSHPILTRVGDERLRHEMVESKARIEAMLGKRADLFCYPNGDFDERVRRAAECAGYRAAATTRSGMNDGRVPPLALHRIDAERDLVHFVQSTSGFEQVKNRVRGVRAPTAGALGTEA